MHCSKWFAFIGGAALQYSGHPHGLLLASSLYLSQDGYCELLNPFGVSIGSGPTHSLQRRRQGVFINRPWRPDARGKFSRTQ